MYFTKLQKLLSRRDTGLRSLFCKPEQNTSLRPVCPQNDQPLYFPRLYRTAHHAPHVPPHFRHKPVRSRRGYPLYPENARSQFDPCHRNLYPCRHGKATGYFEDEASEEGFKDRRVKGDWKIEEGEMKKGLLHWGAEGLF